MKSECRVPSCHNTFTYGHNGVPLVSGQVCDDCNEIVVKLRLSLAVGVYSE